MPLFIKDAALFRRQDQRRRSLSKTPLFFAAATEQQHAHPWPNWIQTNLAVKQLENHWWLQECCRGLRPQTPAGARPTSSPQERSWTPGWLRRKNVAGGSSPRPPMGLRPKPCSRGGLGTKPPASLLRQAVGVVPSFWFFLDFIFGLGDGPTGAMLTFCI